MRGAVAQYPARNCKGAEKADNRIQRQLFYLLTANATLVSNIFQLPFVNSDPWTNTLKMWVWFYIVKM